ncbi:hypothetical protein GCWU000182_01824 [Abiotrophia defectiva ATCC 49176]|uniref:Uncharacterized protein n=1 Tax=Abiotrophia defectiva ATCC 49176 TaxID=592010 RepID=W1Q1L2_ABIDE|nr:hypothetical protein GCWU000182_01824 [Abiotrophia defectiva ATCC 49176]
MTYLKFNLNLGELTEGILSPNQKLSFPRKRFDFFQTCTV